MEMVSWRRREAVMVGQKENPPIIRSVTALGDGRFCDFQLLLWREGLITLCNTYILFKAGYGAKKVQQRGRLPLFKVIV